MGRDHPLKKSTGAGQVASVTALVLLGWSSANYAATFNSADCDGRALSTDSLANHQHFEASKLRPIDHVAIQDNAADVSALNATTSSITIGNGNGTATDSATPFLYLTPRVASALREIFDSSENETPEAAEDNALSSPLAITDPLPDTAEFLDEATNVESMDDELERLMLQRQMFRTDI